jgi:mRNA-degrading endonuclease RelE of RelBE toxin-antitoxin system
MKYTVLWSSKAEAQLTSLWLSSRARQLITEATNAIDSLLAVNPQECGESRSGGARILHVVPLGALFSIDETNRMVVVQAVWQYKTRPKKA